MTEHDPTAIDPAEAITETPPEGFIPQVTEPGQQGGVTEHEPDLISEAELAQPDLQSADDGDADDGDDATDEGDDD